MTPSPGATDRPRATYPDLMLFDLRGKGRRRTVQIIYGGLALLIGGGLIFFGIGGATSGGLLNAVDNQRAAQTDTFNKKVTAARKLTVANPKDPAAWAALTRAQYQAAGVGKNFDTSTGSFTPKGLAELARVDASWQTYLALNPKHPDGDTANLMSKAYGPAALNDPVKAVAAYEIFVGSRPASAVLYAQLAVLADVAGQSRKSQLAEAKALSLATDKVQRTQIQQSIAQARAQNAQNTAQQSGAAAPTTTTP